MVCWIGRMRDGRKAGKGKRKPRTIQPILMNVPDAVGSDWREAYKLLKRNGVTKKGIYVCQLYGGYCGISPPLWKREFVF